MVACLEMTLGATSAAESTQGVAFFKSALVNFTSHVRTKEDGASLSRNAQGADHAGGYVVPHDRRSADGQLRRHSFKNADR